MGGETHVLVSLYDALDRDPSSVEIQERLLEVWKELGDESNETLHHSILPFREQRLTGFDRYGIWNCFRSHTN